MCLYACVCVGMPVCIRSVFTACCQSVRRETTQRQPLHTLLSLLPPSRVDCCSVSTSQYSRSSSSGSNNNNRESQQQRQHKTQNTEHETRNTLSALPFVPHHGECQGPVAAQRMKTCQDRQGMEKGQSRAL